MLVGFDIETSKLAPEDRSASYALGVTCGAVSFQDGTKFAFYPEWGEARDNTPSNDPDAIKWYSEAGKTGGVMSQMDLAALAIYLQKITQEGHKIVTWNGLGFDFRVLYEEVQFNNIKGFYRELALNHLDVMFQVLCTKGFPVGLEACAMAFALGGKKGMHGDEAVEIWASAFQEDRRRVIEYVQGDADLTVQVADRIEKSGQLRWITRKGKSSSMTMSELLTVKQALLLPEPDTSWMDTPIDREGVYAWTGYSPTHPPEQLELFK